ncbi:hypothetical protein OCOL_000722 [Ordospora colligata]
MVNVAMAIITVMVMLSVIVYVINRNRPTWYDIVMIGGSVVMAFMRICTVFMSKYMNIMNIVMIVMSVVMGIVSVVVMVVNDNKNKNDGDNGNENNKSSKMGDTNGKAKNAIVMLSVCVMAITGWVIQVLYMNLRVSCECENGRVYELGQ